MTALARRCPRPAPPERPVHNAADRANRKGDVCRPCPPRLGDWKLRVGAPRFRAAGVFLAPVLKDVGIEWPDGGDAGERDGGAQLSDGPDDDVGDTPGRVCRLVQVVEVGKPEQA